MLDNGRPDSDDRAKEQCAAAETAAAETPPKRETLRTPIQAMRASLKEIINASPEEMDEKRAVYQNLLLAYMVSLMDARVSHRNLHLILKATHGAWATKHAHWPAAAVTFFRHQTGDNGFMLRYLRTHNSDLGMCIKYLPNGESETYVASLDYQEGTARFERGMLLLVVTKQILGRELNADEREFAITLAKHSDLREYLGFEAITAAVCKCISGKPEIAPVATANEPA